MSNVKVVSFFSRRLRLNVCNRLLELVPVPFVFFNSLPETSGHLSKTDTKKRPQRSSS